MDNIEFIDSKAIFSSCSTCGEDTETVRVDNWLMGIASQYGYSLNMCPECHKRFSPMLCIAAIYGVDLQIQEIQKMRGTI